MIDLFILKVLLLFVASSIMTIFSYSIFFIQCLSRKRSESRISGSRRDGTTKIVVIGNGGGGTLAEQESMRQSDNREKSIQNSKSKYGKSKKSKSKYKSLKSPKAETPGKCRTDQESDGETIATGAAGATTGGGTPTNFGRKTESKTKQSEGGTKGKFGDTINDDTLNDTDCDWGAGEVIYKADRSKKKKRKH